MIYRGLRYSSKRGLKLTHATLFGVILALVLIAGVAVYESHNLVDPPIPNFYSIHSWVGIAAMLLFVCQWIGGFVSFLFPQVRAPLKEAIMPYHIFFGLTGYVLAIAAALLGISEKAFFHKYESSIYLKDNFNELSFFSSFQQKSCIVSKRRSFGQLFGIANCFVRCFGRIFSHQKDL